MKLFTNNGIIKKIIIIPVIIVMAFNFIIPSYVYAANSNDERNIAAEILVYGISSFICWLGDTALQAVQEIMIGSGYIGSSQTGYKIQYSPGMIFANEVPTLDINFIKPTEKKIASVKYSEISYETSIKIIDQKFLMRIIQRRNRCIF